MRLIAEDIGQLIVVFIFLQNIFFNIMLQPVKDIDEYTRIKKTLRNKFDAERTGDQHLFIEQSKLLQPLIKPLLSTQEQTVKAIQERPHRPLTAIMPAVISQTSGASGNRVRASVSSGDLRSGASGGERSLEQQSASSHGMPAEAPADSSAVSDDEQPLIKIDLDSGLNDTDIRNLQDMKLDLPSVVFKNKKIEETLNKIKSVNRSIGQKLGKASDIPAQEKEIYISWKETLGNYKQKIQGLEGAKQFVGQGVDVIFYPSIEDLCLKLAEFDAAKQAGNTGIDNRINSVLDELLRTQAISKDVYDNLYKNIFL
jgi:hypothetical protein